MSNVGMFEEAKLEEKVKKLKARVKDLFEINKEHQKMNGKMHSEIEIEKKNNTLLREDLQMKDLEIGRMMKKLAQ
jgi:uncharacterized protein YktB (UPF0637 family)